MSEDKPEQQRGCLRILFGDNVVETFGYKSLPELIFATILNPGTISSFRGSFKRALHRIEHLYTERCRLLLYRFPFSPSHT